MADEIEKLRREIDALDDELAARALGLSRSGLYRRIQKFGL